MSFPALKAGSLPASNHPPAGEQKPPVLLEKQGQQTICKTFTAAETMPTLSETLNRLQAEGYTEDFNLDAAYLTGKRSAIRLTPEEFAIDQHFRFEGNSDPDDEAVVYAISSAKFNLKGTLVNGYGINSNAASDELVKALHEKTPV
jgi:hypothetical protein